MENLNYKLLPYNENDKQFIYDIKKISYQKYVEINYGGWDEEVQQKMFEDFISTTAPFIKIIYIDNTKVGFIDGKDNPDGTYTQGNICILPAFQGKGIGTKILSDIIDKHKHQNITLRVFKQNRARILYERLGFKIVDETKSHYVMLKDKESK